MSMHTRIFAVAFSFLTVVGCDETRAVTHTSPQAMDDAAEAELVDDGDVELVTRLIAQPEAEALRGFLEGQGYRADFDAVSLNEGDDGMANLVLAFEAPTPTGLDAAVVFHVQPDHEVQSVAAIVMDADGAQRLYAVQDGQVVDTRELAQADGAEPRSCDWWVPYGCGECRNTSLLCAYKNRMGYFWGIKWGTCGTCSATNENGCC